MKNTKSLSEKLDGYSLFATGLLASTAVANAQVVYTDVLPDYESLFAKHDSYPIDLNNDGIVDYVLKGYAWTGRDSFITASIDPAPGNSVAYTNSYPGVFHQGEGIDKTLDWHKGNDLLLADDFIYIVGTTVSSHRGNWVRQYGFIALRFDIEGKQYYGWIRLYVGSARSGLAFYLYDYGYEATAEKPINAGDIGCLLFYPDADNDQYGDINSQGDTLCSLPSAGYSTDHSDCNDSSSNVYPGAKELCNDIDDNCNNKIDEGVKSTFYEDADSDGYGNDSITTKGCSAPAGYIAIAGDCNDQNASINPGATEICDNIDNNCNGQIDEGVLLTFYADVDSDGYGDINNSIQACTQPAGYILDSSDCNDHDASVHPVLLEVLWQKSLGGSADDKASFAQQTKDGGYVIAGYSSSKDGDIEANRGFDDYWIAKLDSTGKLQWQRSLGGPLDDKATAIQQTADNGFIVAGSSSSNTTEVTGNHGGTDYWIVKLDSAQKIEWQKSLGGGSDDAAYSIQQTTDGGFIVAGSSSSNDGDVSGNHGGSDYWIVKLDVSGNIEWQKSMGGKSDDKATSVCQIADGGFIVAGFTASNEDDVSGNHGYYDYWIVKLDASGNIEWQKSMGGKSDDEATSIGQTADGGFIVAGYTASSSGDVSGNHGAYDYWIVKLDGLGSVQWQRCLGGKLYEKAFSIQQINNGNFIVAGYAASNDGDLSANQGRYDYWIVKLDASGNIQWQKSLGGSDYDAAASVLQTSDGDFVICGYSNSHDGDVLENQGSSDYWVVKLRSFSGGIEVCNNLDDNCNGKVDDGLVFDNYYADADGDGFGDQNKLINSCAQPLGYVADSTDCNDTNPNIHPGADEIQNGIDDNCNGVIDEFGVGINDPSSSFAFSVFPNPNNGNVAIQATLQHEESLIIKVLDLAGKELYSENLGKVSGKFSKQLNLKNFSAGTYLLQVIHDGKSEMKKMVIAK